MRAIGASGIVFFGVGLSGCGVFTPHLHEDGFAVAEIVQRVKCELAYAVPDFGGRYPSGGYQWMKYWTAKVDLTLEVNDSSSIKPNSTYATPVTGGTFTIGAGGELTTQAQRTEKLSFTVSMKELVESRGSTFCLLPQRAGLMGNLGLEEWIVSSLAPVENRQLTIGFHQPPTGKTATIPIEGPKSAAPKVVQPLAKRLLDDALEALRRGEKGTEVARERAASARKFARQVRFQKTYDAVDQTYGLVEAASAALENAIDLAWRATAANRDAAPNDHLSTTDADVLSKIPTQAKAVGEQLAKAKTTATEAWNLLPRDTPIDSIVHTLKFVVTVGASATPNFTLVRFKGPGLTSPFASASQIRTNTLDVVLGMPAIAGGKALSDEQNRQLFNIQLDQLRRTIVVPLQ